MAAAARVGNWSPSHAAVLDTELAATQEGWIYTVFFESFSIP